jgi:hypothetical protein
MRQLLQIRQLVNGRRNASDRAATNANGRASYLFDHTLGLQGIIYPRIVKLKGTFGNSFISIAIGIDAGVSTVNRINVTSITLCE